MQQTTHIIKEDNTEECEWWYKEVQYKKNIGIGIAIYHLSCKELGRTCICKDCIIMYPERRFPNFKCGYCNKILPKEEQKFIYLYYKTANLL